MTNNKLKTTRDISCECYYHKNGVSMVRTERIRNLEFVAKSLLEYIDAIPEDVVASFPTMPGIDRDFVDDVINS